MISLNRLTACTAGLCALASLALALSAPPERESDQGPAPQGTGPGADPLEELLSPPPELCLARSLPKVKVVQDLLAGRLSLLEAAMRFQELSEAGPPFDWERFRRPYRGRSDLERFCRQLVATGDLYLSQVDPPRQAAVRTRLEAEL